MNDERRKAPSAYLAATRGALLGASVSGLASAGKLARVAGRVFGNGPNMTSVGGWGSPLRQKGRELLGATQTGSRYIRNARLRSFGKALRGPLGRRAMMTAGKRALGSAAVVGGIFGGVTAFKNWGNRQKPLLGEGQS